MLSSKTLFLLLCLICAMSFIVVLGQELEIDPDQEVDYNNHFEPLGHQQQQKHVELAAEHDHIILRAASSRNVEWMREILDRDPEAVNANNLQGWNSLMYAAANDYPEIVQELINRGADVNHFENDMWTPLMFAAFQGREDIIHILAEGGANLLHTNKEGLTAHELARAQGHDSVARILGERTILQALSRDEGMEAMMQHIQLGLNPNIANSQGWTPLIYASARGFEIEARQLIALGALVDLAENDGWTPLMFAANNGFHNLVKLYLSHGADIDHVSRNNRSAYSQAKEHQYEQVLEVLDEHKRMIQEEIEKREAEEIQRKVEEITKTNDQQKQEQQIPVPASALGSNEEKKKKGFLGLWN